MKTEFLLEIGTEEIPAGFLKPAARCLKIEFEKCLQENLIEYENIKLYYTPKRLVIYIENISLKTKEKQEMIYGPPIKIAIDEKGNYTKAAIGFAKKYNKEPDSLVKEKKDNKEYVALKIIIKEKNSAQILEKNIPDIIKNINFKKKMSWEKTKFKFARPIRWILCLMDNKVLKIKIADIEASNKTKGHRFLGKEDIEINSCEQYFKEIEANKVILDVEKRKQIIKDKFLTFCRENNLQEKIDNDLLEEVANLTEYPVPIITDFDKEYLYLPDEILEQVMKDHQKYFCFKINNRLTNHFMITVSGEREDYDLIIKGNKNVIKARFDDAKFYYEKDIKIKLEDRIELLKKIAFFENTGSVFDKIQRMKNTGSIINNKLNNIVESILLEKSIELSKCDLTTGVVGEFPELQGIIGSKYAQIQNYDSEVAAAIGEQYLPKAGENPQTLLGSLLSLIDKIDSIFILFKFGYRIKGAYDPLALRQNCIGILKIIDLKNLRLNFGDLIDDIEDIYELDEGTKKDIKDFFQTRIINYFSDIRPDIIRAAIESAGLELIGIKKRVEILKQYTSKPEFNELTDVCSRILNIIKDEEFTHFLVSESLLKEKAEQELYYYYLKIEDDLKRYLEEEKFDNLLDEYLKMKPLIDCFFDNVLVNVEEKELQINRKNLLRLIGYYIIKGIRPFRI